MITKPLQTVKFGHHTLTLLPPDTDNDLPHIVYLEYAITINDWTISMSKFMVKPRHGWVLEISKLNGDDINEIFSWIADDIGDDINDVSNKAFPAFKKLIEELFQIVTEPSGEKSS